MATQMPYTSFSVELIASWIFPFKSSYGFYWIGEYCLSRFPYWPVPFAKNCLLPRARRNFLQGW